MSSQESSFRQKADGEIKFGIVLATYNPDPQYFQQQVESLLKQTHQNWHCWVVDDVSPEQKRDEIRQILQNNFKFTFIENQENKGVKFNFARGLSLVDESVDIVALCDQDDVWKEDKLEILRNRLKHSDKVLIHSDLELIDERNQVIATSCWSSEQRLADPDLAQLCLRNTVTGCATAFLPKLLSIALPFPTDDKRHPAYLHDHWLAVCAKLQGGILEETRALVQYRQHGGNVVGAHGRSGQGGDLIAKSKVAWSSRQKLVGDLLLRAKEKNLATAELDVLQKKFQSILSSTRLILNQRNKFSLRLLAQRLLAEFKR